MRKVKLTIPYKTLKQAVDANGDVEIELNLDLDKDPNFPTGKEICIESGYFKNWRDDKKFNDRFCLIENVKAAFINGDYYALPGAVYRTLFALYNRPGHQLHYTEFAKLYAGVELKTSEAGRAASSAIRHANNFFQKAKVPARLVRENGVVSCLIKGGSQQ
jgi:hypothetical protein